MNQIRKAEKLPANDKKAVLDFIEALMIKNQIKK